MIDTRFKVTDEILTELKRMKRVDDASPSQMIWFLFRAGVPKAGAVVALRHAGVLPVEQTKEAVHFHEAYAFRRASDEAFSDSVLQGLESLRKEENTAAA